MRDFCSVVCTLALLGCAWHAGWGYTKLQHISDGFEENMRIAGTEVLEVMAFSSCC